jgi:hypothetical protein
MDVSKLEFDELFDAIKRNLNKQDSKLLKYLIYPNDLQNLIKVFGRELKGWDVSDYKKPGIFHTDEIKAYKKNRRNFPDFMNDFLSENEDRLANMSLQEIEDALVERFYKEVFSLNNNFLSSYYRFTRELKSLVAAFNYNTYDFLTQPNISDADRLILQVGPDRTPSASVLKDYPQVEELIQVFSKDQPEKTERFIDQVIWNFLDEMSGEQFSREAVFAYTLKLQLLQRWTRILSNPDAEAYENLLDKIMNNPSEKTPVL